MVICDHVHECDKECNHRVMHDHTSICDWTGCTWQHPRKCVEESSATLISFVAEVKAMGKLEELKVLLKEPRRRTPRAPEPPKPAISTTGARPSKSIERRKRVQRKEGV